MRQLNSTSAAKKKPSEDADQVQRDDDDEPHPGVHPGTNAAPRNVLPVLVQSRGHEHRGGEDHKRKSCGVERDSELVDTSTTSLH